MKFFALNIVLLLVVHTSQALFLRETIRRGVQRVESVVNDIFNPAQKDLSFGTPKVASLFGDSNAIRTTFDGLIQSSSASLNQSLSSALIPITAVQERLLSPLRAAIDVIQNDIKQLNVQYDTVLSNFQHINRTAETINSHLIISSSLIELEFLSLEANITASSAAGIRNVTNTVLGIINTLFFSMSLDMLKAIPCSNKFIPIVQNFTTSAVVSIGECMISEISAFGRDFEAVITTGSLLLTEVQKFNKSVTVCVSGITSSSSVSENTKANECLADGLSATPVPEPQFTVVQNANGAGAWLSNAAMRPMVVFNRFVFAIRRRMATQVSTNVVTIIKTVNKSVGENVETCNKTCTNAANSIAEEYDSFQTESVTMDSATTVTCSGAMLSANVYTIQVSYGASAFFNSISGFGPPKPSDDSGTFGDALPYPTPQSVMPDAPAPGANPPYPPAVGVQSRYARTVLARMLSDVLSLTRNVDEFKETTGSTCESVSTTETQTIKELFIDVTFILTKYENQKTNSRLISVLSAQELEQVNKLIMKITQTVEFTNNSMKSGIKEMKTKRKTNAYEKTVQEVRENKKSSEEFSKKVNEIRKGNEKSGKRYVSRAFNSARDSNKKSYESVTVSRTSLVEQSKVMVKSVRDSAYWMAEQIVKPKLVIILTKLDKIPICLNIIFGNLTISISGINNATETSNNNTYQNASTVVSQAVTNLTDIIGKDCTCKINCAQTANEKLQEIQCKFHRESKTCMEQVSSLNQRAITNCTNTTINISQNFNDMVSKSDKCIHDSGAPNTYYVNYLGYLVRQKIVICLDPVDKDAENFCTNASTMCAGSRSVVAAVSIQIRTSYKNCTTEKVKDALQAIKEVSENYSICSMTQPSPPPTTAASTSTGSSTTGSSTTSSSTTGSSSTGGSTTGSSTTGSSTTGSSTTGSSSTGSTATCGCHAMSTTSSTTTTTSAPGHI
ncbi:unnamed protein product [Diamesa serratosioi]